MQPLYEKSTRFQNPHELIFLLMNSSSA